MFGRCPGKNFVSLARFSYLTVVLPPLCGNTPVPITRPFLVDLAVTAITTAIQEECSVHLQRHQVDNCMNIHVITGEETRRVLLKIIKK